MALKTTSSGVDILSAPRLECKTTKKKGITEYSVDYFLKMISCSVYKMSEEM